MASPTEDDKDELLLACRYGDLEDVQHFVDQFGPGRVAEVVDSNGNTVIHMAAGNGHQDVLDYILPIVPPSLLSAQNHSGSTPLHWAALNAHLSVVKQIVQLPDGPGSDLIDIKNKAGRSPLAEAEMVGWDEGAQWLVETMRLDPGPREADKDDHMGDDEAIVTKDIQVEIEDADGQIAGMTIKYNSSVDHMAYSRRLHTFTWESLPPSQIIHLGR
ncbi:hypothetical protein Agabi119p4_2133 [Agaricus bisporus var. burnettii]|uniref:Ankyrin n=1 Tax=Agaricus bisporus var. burnettii TaxID=192524 RepID=A0A8H7F8M9_AGABI|nr:hypothetical protein Agabi119p4_2133 [Agaricus bisporus var. burnettii]